MVLRALSIFSAMMILLGVAPAYAQVCYKLPFSNPDLADGWGSTCCGRSNPHRGVDFPQPGGTPIPSVADGTVVVKATSSCLGNVVVLRHADGYYSSYSHMQTASPLGIGANVNLGDQIGKVGTTGTCTTGNHLHLTISDHESGWGSGTTVDPYQFITQRDDCTPCDHTAGPFSFSCDGPEDGQSCALLDEPQDPDSWSDNYLCTAVDDGLVFSDSGEIDGLKCTHITESADVDHGWDNNFVCVPTDYPWELQWSNAGAIDGQSCVRWNEPADPDTWTDNFLCSTNVYDFFEGDFAFSNRSAIDGMICVSVNEPLDAAGWDNNFFCSKQDLGLVWSSAGAIDGMECTQVSEPNDLDSWEDNYLCAPADADYLFEWSHAGRIEGKTCVRWYESSDLAVTWNDNYLCLTKKLPAAVIPDEASPNNEITPTESGTHGGSTQDDEIVADGGCGCGTTSAIDGALPLLFLGLLSFRRRKPGSVAARRRV